MKTIQWTNGVILKNELFLSKRSIFQNHYFIMVYDYLATRIVQIITLRILPLYYGMYCLFSLRVVAEVKSARCKQFNQLGHKIRQRLQAMQSLLADSRMKTITEEDNPT